MCYDLMNRRESSSTAAGDLFSGPATTKPLSMDTITDNEKTMILEACADLGRVLANSCPTYLSIHLLHLS